MDYLWKPSQEEKTQLKIIADGKMILVIVDIMFLLRPKI